jgi:hypothetical protein
MLHTGRREECVADDRVLDEVQEISGRGPARRGLHSCERDAGGASAEIAGATGIAQLEAGGRHILQDGLQFYAVRTNRRERQVAERDPRLFGGYVIALQHRGQRRHGHTPEHRGRLDNVAQFGVEIVEQHLDQFLDHLCRWPIFHDEVGVADERFAREFQRERVTMCEALRALGPFTRESFAGDELGGVGRGERPRRMSTRRCRQPGAVRHATLGGLRPIRIVVVEAGSEGNSPLRNQPSTTPNRS